jgi:beta-xylosidase
MVMRSSDLPEAVRERIEALMKWETSTQSRSDVNQTVFEIAELHAGGLSKASDLVFHEVWLGDHPMEDTVLVYGVEGSEHYYCKHVPALEP